MIDTKQIAVRVKHQRKEVLHISQEKMAEDLGMYQCDISKLETGSKCRAIHDLITLGLIAEYLKVSPQYLIFGISE